MSVQSSQNIETAQRGKKVPDLNDGTGNGALLSNLSSLGINLFAGTNGGGAIHTSKYMVPLERLDQVNCSVPHFFTIPETTAGFIPIGYHWATGRIAGTLLTTGGAGVDGLKGLIAAKMHNIPTVTLAALSASDVDGETPLQYTGREGSNTFGMYKALLGDSCFVVDHIGCLESILTEGIRRLQQSKPIAILFHPDILSQKVEHEFQVSWKEQQKKLNKLDVRSFLTTFPDEILGRRVVIYVGEEAASYNNIADLITEFSTLLKAPTLYSMNSVNAVSPSNPFAAGYIHLGFNDFSRELWSSLNQDDVVVCIGYDPGEYEMNSGNIPGKVWHLTNEKNPYSSRKGGFAHRVKGEYRKVKGDLELSIRTILEGLREKHLSNIPVTVPSNLNTNEDYGAFDADTVDLVTFYKTFPNLARNGTVIVNDVCQAYKDLQRVTMRPLRGIEVYSSHRDSYMSGGFGVAIGFKFGRPNSEVEYFTGDGCYKYFGASLGFLKYFGLGVWVIDNGNHHIVDKGLDVIYGDTLDRERHHGLVPRDDYVASAKAKGWDAHLLAPDFDNLEFAMSRKYANSSAAIPISTLIQMPVDGTRVIGQNARLLNLGKQGKPNL